MSSSRVRSRAHWAALVSVAAAAWLQAACNSGEAVGTGSPASVSITSAVTQAIVGQFWHYSATPLDKSGRPVTADVYWSSSNDNVATVTFDGTVTATGPGTATITATAEAAHGSVDITVVPWVLPAPSTNAVSSVTIVPANATVPLLGSAKFTAVPRDAQERLVDRPVTWSAGNGLIATVTSAGLVTGLTLGSTALQAASEGVLSSVPLQVSLLPVATPVWPNLPANYTPVADEPFDTLAKFWSVLWNDDADGSFTLDPTSPGTPGGVYQIRYPIGFHGGAAPATLNYVLGGVSRVFVGTWWKASANWQGHPSYVNKIQFLFPATGGDMYLAAYGPPGGPYELRGVVQLPGFEKRDKLVPNVDPGVISLGEWHRIEWLVEYNSPGTPDGMMRWWLDGKLVGDYRDLQFPPSLLEYLKLSPTWGGIGGTKTQTDYYWYDHVFVARKP